MRLFLAAFLTITLGAFSALASPTVEGEVEVLCGRVHIQPSDESPGVLVHELRVPVGRMMPAFVPLPNLY